jgi:hypothetical protein
MASNGTGSKPPAAGSSKSAVIEAIFLDRWNDKTKKLRNPVVTFQDITSTIAAIGSKLSTRNPANFLKDIVRRTTSANRIWPRSVFDKGYTGVQETGEGVCFRFVSIASGQTEPFPKIAYPRNPATAYQHKIQSVSLAPFARLLGRTDETWLIQVLVRLNVVQTHFALFSKSGLLYVDHLQTGVKGTKTEIDALFLGETSVASGKAHEIPRRALITLEAKKRGEDILEEQILRQIETALEMPALKKRIDQVIPIAAKALGGSKVYLVEYEAIPANTKAPKVLDVAIEGVYTIVPPVEGLK